MKAGSGFCSYLQYVACGRRVFKNKLISARKAFSAHKLVLPITNDRKVGEESFYARNMSNRVNMKAGSAFFSFRQYFCSYIDIHTPRSCARNFWYESGTQFGTPHFSRPVRLCCQALKGLAEGDWWNSIDAAPITSSRQRTRLHPRHSLLDQGPNILHCTNTEIKSHRTGHTGQEAGAGRNIHRHSYTTILCT